jgi:hypothetical protein
LCAEFVYRGGENLARAAAMKRACRNGFLYCEYTGLPMNLTDEESPLYMEFDHPIPGKKGFVRAVVAFVNRMKTDLSEDEFWAAVHEFARIRREGGELRDVIEFKYWRRKRKLAAKRKAALKKSPDRKGRSIGNRTDMKKVIGRISRQVKASGMLVKDVEMIIRKARKRKA